MWQALRRHACRVKNAYAFLTIKLSKDCMWKVLVS